MHKSFAFSLIATSLLLSADEPASTPPPPAAVKRERKKAPEVEVNCVLNSTPATTFPKLRTEDSWNLFITGEALFWKAHEDGLAFASKGEEATFESAASANPFVSNTADKLKIKEARSKWDWDYRFGLGYNIGHDQWDLYLCWTHFFTNATRTLSIPPVTTVSNSAVNISQNYPVIFPLLLAPGNTPSAGTIDLVANRWQLHLNLIDLELGRQFFVSKWLMLRPYAGLRSGWIHQKLDTAYTGVLTAVAGGTPTITSYSDAVAMKNDFWGLGVRAGLDTQWGLVKYLSIYANAAVSLLYGAFDVDYNDASQSTSTTTGLTSQTSNAFSLDNNFHATRAITDLAIGLRYDQMLFLDRFHLGIWAGWEHHLFFNQNQFMHLLNSTSAKGSFYTDGDLSLQGWVFGMRIDF